MGLEDSPSKSGEQNRDSERSSVMQKASSERAEAMLNLHNMSKEQLTAFVKGMTPKQLTACCIELEAKEFSKEEIKRVFIDLLVQNISDSFKGTARDKFRNRFCNVTGEGLVQAIVAKKEMMKWTPEQIAAFTRFLYFMQESINSNGQNGREGSRLAGTSDFASPASADKC